MRWDDFRRSDNVEDNRSGQGGFGSGVPGGAGGLSVGVVMVLGLIGYALGIDPRVLIGGAEMLTKTVSTPAQVDRTRQPSGTPQAPPSDRTGQFIAAVLGDTEDRWKEIFRQAKLNYRAPRLRLFTKVDTTSGCVTAQAAMGPFYCPRDSRIYMDTSFFQDLQTRFQGCPVGSKVCEFAQTYVIAHEVGHHVQNLLGILARVQQQQASLSKVDANRMQVRVELQADCFAGIWAHHAEAKWKFLEPGDVEAAMQTAAAIGDDMLQRRARGHVVPDSFTHGTSAQRQRWFMTGLREGRIGSCNTFTTDNL